MQDWRLLGRKPGERLAGVYPVVRRLGSGTFGEVFLCRHSDWNIEVAIKVPREGILPDPSMLSELQKEAEEWTGLGLHPFIAYCYCLHPIGDLPLFIVEYAPGGTLRDRIERSPEAVQDLRGNLDLAIQLCHALEHAHGRGLIHRDIKPENILIGADGVAKLTDFGIAKRGVVAAASKQVVVADQTTAWGTRGYMAPEQAIAGARIDDRADLFALGATLFELFCFRRPYDITEGPPQEPLRPSDLRRDRMVPKQLEELLLRLVAWEPDGRPASAQIVRAELTEIYHDTCGEESLYAELPDLQLTASGHNNRGVSYHFLGKHAEAEAAFKEALAVHPLHPEGTYNLGLIRWRKGEIADDRLLSQLEQNRLSNSGWRSAYLLGLVHLERRDREAAVKLLEEACRARTHERSTTEALERARAIPDAETSELAHILDELQGEVAFSPDGQKMLFGSWDSLLLWDLPTGNCVRLFEGYTNAVAFSPDGRQILSTDPGRAFRLWDVATGNCLRTFEGHIYRVAFSPDGQQILYESSDGTLRLWDIASGECLRTFGGATDPLSSPAFSPEGRHILYESSSYTCGLGDLVTGKCVWTFEGHIDRLPFSPNGRHVLSALSAGPDYTLHLWDVASGKCLRNFEGHTGIIGSFMFSPDGEQILSGSSDHTIRLWDVATAKCLRIFEGHTDLVSSVAFSPDGRQILSGSSDHTLRLWDVATGKCLRTFEGHIDPVRSVAFSPDGRHILGQDKRKTLRVWEVGQLDFELHNRSKLQRAQPVQLADMISNAAKRAASLAVVEAARADGRIGDALRALAELEALPEQRRHPQIVELRRQLATRCWRGALRSSWLMYLLAGGDKYHRVTISPDGRVALFGSSDVGPMRLWEFATGQCLRTFEGHHGSVTSVAFSPDGRFALSGSNDNTVRQWEVATGRCLRRFEGHDIEVTSVAFSANGRLVLSASSRGIRLWDVMTEECLRTIAHSDGMHSVAFSADGRFALSGSYVGPMRFWDLATGQCIRTLAGSGEGNNSVVLSRDASLVVSVSATDKTLRLWDVETGKCLRIFEGHSDSVHSAVLSRDGELVLSGSHDGTVRLWRTQSGKCLCVLGGHRLAIWSVDVSSDATLVVANQGDAILAWHLDWELLDRPLAPAVQDSAPAAFAAVSWQNPLSRNDPCPCGSGKRFKHCHGAYH